MTTTPPKLLIGVPEIAKHIGRSERQVYWLIETGELPVFRMGHRHVMMVGAYEELIESRSAAALARVQ